MPLNVFIICLVAIICGTSVIIFSVFMVFGAVRRKHDAKWSKSQDNEMIREIWEGLQKMEDRASNLETILRQKKSKSRSESNF